MQGIVELRSKSEHVIGKEVPDSSYTNSQQLRQIKVEFHFFVKDPNYRICNQ